MLLVSPEPVHHRRHEMLALGVSSQNHSFFFLVNGFRRDHFIEMAIVSPTQRIEVIVVIGTQLKRRLIGIALDSGWHGRVFVGGKEALKGAAVIIGVQMGVLKLMDIADSREILFIVRAVDLKRAHSLEDSSVRLINLHQLQIIPNNKTIITQSLHLINYNSVLAG